MTPQDGRLGNGMTRSEASKSKLLISEDPPNKDLDNIPGSVMDGMHIDLNEPSYKVFKYRWLILALFVIFSASNSMQWTQYTIIQDIVVSYYGVSGNLVSWTSIVYMITYVPLIFPASWLLSRTVGLFTSFLAFHSTFVQNDLKIVLSVCN